MSYDSKKLSEMIRRRKIHLENSVERYGNTSWSSGYWSGSIESLELALVIINALEKELDRRDKFE